MSLKSGLVTLIAGTIGIVGTLKLFSYYKNKIDEIKLEVPMRVWYVEDEINKIRNSPYVCLANNLKDPNFVENYRQLLIESERYSLKQEVKSVSEKIEGYSERKLFNCSILGAGSIMVLLKGLANLYLSVVGARESKNDTQK